MTVKVRAIAHTAGLRRGQVVELSDEEALDLLDTGLVELVDRPDAPLRESERRPWLVDANDPDEEATATPPI